MVSKGMGGAPVREAEAKGEQVSRSDSFEWLARGGLLARGVVYAIIGILAIRLAFGSGGEATNQQGALQEVVQQPFGKVLLAVMAIGLAGYAIWRLVRAALATAPRPATIRRTASRAWRAASPTRCSAAPPCRS